jgi:hypothetical protein
LPSGAPSLLSLQASMQSGRGNPEIASADFVSLATTGGASV